MHKTKIWSSTNANKHKKVNKENVPRMDSYSATINKFL